MRRLTRREKSLVVVFAALAILAGVSIYFSPREAPDVEEVLAFYANAFEGGQEITIRSATGDAEPITVRGVEALRLLSRLSLLVRFGAVSARPSPNPPKWILDVTGRDGSKVKDIGVGFHLETPKQPARGVVWVIPRRAGQDGSEPAMVEVIDQYVESLRPRASEGEPE